MTDSQAYAWLESHDIEQPAGLARAARLWRIYPCVYMEKSYNADSIVKRLIGRPNPRTELADAICLTINCASHQICVTTVRNKGRKEIATSMLRDDHTMIPAPQSQFSPYWMVRVYAHPDLDQSLVKEVVPALMQQIATSSEPY